MKKIILVIMLVITSSPLYAYFYFEPGSIVLYPGAMGKVYSHTFDKNTDAEIDPKGGANYAAGASLDIFFSDTLALTTGAYYDRCVEEYKIYASGNQSMTADFTFITMPLGIHYYFYDFHFIGAGCYYGKHRDSEFSYTRNGVQSVDTSHMKDDIGIWVQLGYAVEITERINLLIYIEGKRSLSGAYENEASPITNLKRNELNVGTAFGCRI